MAATYSPEVQELVRRLDAAICDDACACCEGVKKALHDIVESGDDFVSESLLRPAPDTYARRLLHMDPAGRYSVMVMVWDTGQGTKIHDHAGMWCVECVYRGKIKVVSYRMEGDDEKDERVNFVAENTIYAGPGEAGALIPPFDHHTIENEESTPAVTLHVYGGEMTWCHVFVPVEGGFKKELKQLSYTKD